MRWRGVQEAKAGMPTVSKINVTPVEEKKPHVVVEEPPTYANKMVRRSWGSVVQRFRDREIFLPAPFYSIFLLFCTIVVRMWEHLLSIYFAVLFGVRKQKLRSKSFSSRRVSVMTGPGSRCGTHQPLPSPDST